MSSLTGTRITWLGHATVLVQTANGTNILIDPFIAQNPKYPKGFALPAKIHYILLTHGHGDHISDAVPVAARARLDGGGDLRAGRLCRGQGSGQNNRDESGRNRATG